MGNQIRYNLEEETLTQNKERLRATHETESPWLLHFKHSRWWKRWSRSKFAPHDARGTNGVSLWMQDGFLHGIKWIMFHGHLDYLQKPFLGDRPNTKPRDHGMHSERSQTLIMQQIRLDNFLYVKNWWCTLPCIPFLLSFMVPNCFYGWRLISMIICSLMLTNQGLIDMLSTTSVRTCAMIWRGPNL